jgi:hypothetical protein
MRDYGEIPAEYARSLNPERPEGRRNLKARGGKRGWKVAWLDLEAKRIIRNKDTLKEVARRESQKMWAKYIQDYPRYDGEDPNEFNIELMERLYSFEFCAVYTEEFDKRFSYELAGIEERVLPSQENISFGPSVRVVDTKYTNDSRVYELELMDPQYPGDRFSFEVQIDNSGETELRER